MTDKHTSAEIAAKAAAERDNEIKAAKKAYVKAVAHAKTDQEFAIANAWEKFLAATTASA